MSNRFVNTPVQGRAMKLHALAIALLIAPCATNTASAQATSGAILLEPLSSDGVDRVAVRNIYGKCGSSIVQVFGVLDEKDAYFSVDSGGDNADIVVIQAGGSKKISLKRHMSDYNGVACVGTGARKQVLVWSACSGSACGDGYNFTIVDPASLRILAGGASPCDAACATRITGSPLPGRLNP